MNDLTVLYQRPADLQPAWFKEFVESVKALGVTPTEVASTSSLIGAIRQVKTAFFMIVDPCDVLEPDAIRVNLETIRGYPHMGFIGTHVRFITRSGTRIGASTGVGYALERMLSDMHAVYKSAIYRKALVEPHLTELESHRWQHVDYAIRLILVNKTQCEVSRRCGYYIRFRDDKPMSEGIPADETLDALRALDLIGG